MSIPQKPKAILFDLDGVVNNSRYFSLIYSEKYNVPLDDIQKVFNDGRKDLTNIGKADLKEIMAEVLADWQWTGTVEELITLWFETDLNVDMKVINSIKKLRRTGIKCYLATDQEKYRTKYLWEEKKICQYFDGKFISCEVGFVKYQKEFFETAIKQLKLPAKEILYIDDSQNKLDVAKQTGIQTYLYTSYEEFKKFIKI
jgi:putative hydrolase of the HAD superfamily